MVLNALPALITTAQMAQMSLIGPHPILHAALEEVKLWYSHTLV